MPATNVLAGIGVNTGNVVTTSCSVPILTSSLPLGGSSPSIVSTATAHGSAGQGLTAAVNEALKTGKGPSAKIIVAPGIPAVKKCLIDSIITGECIDLTELPPAKGRSKQFSGVLEGQVVLIHASDYFQAKRLLPDVATWIQCFSIYTAIVLHYQPDRATAMLMYMSKISNLSSKFKWPSWVIYDQAIRQEAADSGRTDWSKIDSGIHSQCFNGMAKSGEGWCRFCHSLDHLYESCPLRPIEVPGTKRAASHSTYPTPKRGNMSAPVCGKYNAFNGKCSFGPSCKYLHICKKCRGEHPVTQCGKPREIVKK